MKQTIDSTPNNESAEGIVASLYDPKIIPFDEIADEVLEIEGLCFSRDEEGYDLDTFKSLFELTEHFITVVVTKNKNVIGYTCAHPDPENEEAIHIATTNIHPDYQGKKLVGKLMVILEHEAKRRGYKFITRHAAVENGYADKVQKSYAGRIVDMDDVTSELYGEQRYFKILIK